MKTILDNHKELELEGLRYDGKALVAELVELVKGERNNIVKGSERYDVVFPHPAAHALTEEFPAATAGIVGGQDTGFLRAIESEGLRVTLGLNQEQFEAAKSYALITAHEILIVFCTGSPYVDLRA